MKRGSDVEIWALGSMTEKAMKAAEILKDNIISASVVNMEFAKPIDEERLLISGYKFPLICTLEDNVTAGGIGEEIAAFLANQSISANNNVKIINIGWPDTFVEHGTCDELYAKYHMDAKSIAERIVQEFERQA